MVKFSARQHLKWEQFEAMMRSEKRPVVAMPCQEEPAPQEFLDRQEDSGSVEISIQFLPDGMLVLGAIPADVFLKLSAMAAAWLRSEQVIFRPGQGGYIFYRAYLCPACGGQSQILPPRPGYVCSGCWR